jgi:hypothetical protein
VSSSPIAHEKLSPGFKTPRDIPLGKRGGWKKKEKEEEQEEDDDEKGRFRVPREIHIPSPAKKTRFREKLKNGLGGEECKSAFRMPSGHDENDVAIHSSEVDSGFKKPIELPNDNISTSSRATTSTKENLVFDLEFEIDDDDSPLSPLSSVSSTLWFSQAEMDRLAAISKPQAVCPMCKEPVEAGFLREFSKGMTLKVRQQRLFCQAHKKQTAKVDWVEKGYPNIDWDAFDERLQRHFSALKKTLAPEEPPSFYRNMLESTLTNGKQSDLRLTILSDGLDSMSCGYYGPRGGSKMCVVSFLSFVYLLRTFQGTTY